MTLARPVEYGHDEKAAMNPAEIANALVYGIPLVTVIGCSYEGLMLARGRSQSHHKQLLKRAVRSSVRDDDDSFRIVIAETPSQFDAADSLVDRRYRWRGYGTAPTQPATSKDSDHLHSAMETTLIVKGDETTAGTLTVRRDGPGGLLSERTYPDSIDTIRASGAVVCELNRLAIAESANTRKVFAKLLSVAHFITRRIYSASDILIEVNPRHVEFYCRVLGFTIGGSERRCERVGAPSVLLRLELDALEQRFAGMGMGFSLDPLPAMAA